MLPTITPSLNNKAPNKRGLVPIVLLIVYKRKLYRKATGIMVEPDHFIDKTIINKADNYAYKNRMIRNQISEIELRFIKLKEKELLNEITIKEVLSGGGEDLKMDRLKEIVVTRYKGLVTPGTMKQIEAEFSKMQGYKDVPISSMNKVFFKGYEQHMVATLKNKQNTVRKTLVKLKSIFQKAVTLGIVENNPLDGYAMPSYTQPARQYLNKEEIEKIEKYANEGANEFLQLVAKWFLLQCYSGLRYEDLVHWNEKKMVQGNKLIIVDNKTKTPHYIPLYPALLQAIERVRGIDKIPSNQLCNRSLQEIAKLEGIGTHITTHIARHTFAVSFLNNGGSMIVLSKLLGHSNLKTTSIYGQITDKRIDDEAKFLE